MYIVSRSQSSSTQERDDDDQTWFRVFEKNLIRTMFG